MSLLNIHNKFLFLTITIVNLIACTNNKSTEKHTPKKEAEVKNLSEPLILISDSTNTLDKKIQTLQLQYTLWGCACANWITNTDAIKYKDSGFIQHHIFIEPVNDSLYTPAGDSTFDISTEKIIVTGQFYVKEDYPHPSYKMEEPMSKARVFRYFKIKRVKK
jgi:hypothetical protein